MTKHREIWFRTVVGLCVLIVLLTLNGTRYSQQPAITTSEPIGPLVKLNITVVDSANRSVDAIQKEDLQVLENKLEQKILSVDADERPVDIAIAIDASGSFKEIFPFALEAAKLVITDRRPSDEVFIGSFISSDRVESVQEFTTDTDALLKSLSLFRIGGGQSAVVDAIYLTADHLAKHKADEDRRKALVIITDGEERNSYYKAEEVTKLLREKNIQLYALAVTMKLSKESGFIRLSPRDMAEKFLRTLAKETGGRVFFSKTPTQLSEVTLELVRDLKRSYRISYRSSNVTGKKGFRKVDVKLTDEGNPKRIAIASPGYFFTPPTTVLTKKP